MIIQKKWLVFLVCGLLILITVFNKYDTSHLAYAGEGPSTIAGISVENLSDDEIQQLLKEAIIQWGSQQVIVSGGGETLELTMEGLKFDVSTTIEIYRMLSKKSWYAFWTKEPAVTLPLELIPNDNLKRELEKVAIWDAEATYNKLLTHAANLGAHKIDAVLNKSVQLEGERIFVHTEPLLNNALGTDQFISKLNEQFFEANTVVSFYELIQPEQLTTNVETLNYFASLLYNVALHMNAEIVERTSQQQEPNYLRPGVEAVVSKNGTLDLKFKPVEAFKLKAEHTNGAILLEAYAQTTAQLGTKLVINHEIVSPRIVTRFSKQLKAGEVKLVQREKAGARYTVKRFTKDGQGEIISKDYYPPQNRIILKSNLDAVESDFIERIIVPAQAGVDLDGDGLADFEGEELTIEERLEIDSTVYDKSGSELSGK